MLSGLCRNRDGTECSVVLASGVSSLLSDNHFHKQRECTTGNEFTDFLVECQSDFHNQTPFMTGSIAEWTSTSNDPIITSTDNQQNVMAVLVGTNPGDFMRQVLLQYQPSWAMIAAVSSSV